MKYLNLGWLKTNCKKIHYFGLGFIQLKLSDSQRMHFYTPELPPITDQEDIHNHRYNFHSQLLKGFFTQELFQVTDGNTHILEQESCRVGVEASPEWRSCGVLKLSEHQYTLGSRYSIDHRVFHRVSADRAITLLTREPYSKELAEVVRPVGVEKICPFSKQVAEEDLWNIVSGMIS